MRYTCVFEFEDLRKEVMADCILHLKNGFWINKDFEFTLGSDCKFWIPPSKISYIIKEK